MSAYYGGRSECRIRRTPLPVVYCDFLSMYPTVCALMGIWKHLTNARITVEDRTEDVRALLDNLTIDDCLDPKLWPRLVGIARIIPDARRYSQPPEGKVNPQVRCKHTANKRATNKQLNAKRKPSRGAPKEASALIDRHAAVSASRVIEDQRLHGAARLR